MPNTLLLVVYLHAKRLKTVERISATVVGAFFVSFERAVYNPIIVSMLQHLRM